MLTISLHEHPATLFPGTGLAVGDRRAGRRGLRRSTWRCPPAPATRAGCGPSTRWCRRCCARSARRCWSASTAATRTGSTRWPTWSSAWTASGAAHAAVHELAHEVAGGRWLLTGGGGYELVQVVPADLDPPARRGLGRADRPGGAGAGGLAGAGRRADRRKRADPDDGRRPGRVHSGRRGDRSGRPGRCRDHEHMPGRICLARPDLSDVTLSSPMKLCPLRSRRSLSDVTRQRCGRATV